MKTYLLLISLFFLISCKQTKKEVEDRYLWLEEVESAKSLEFVKKQNEKTLQVLSSQPMFQKIYDKSLEVLNSKEQIESPTVWGDYIYNLWQDQDHERGIWRRSLKSDYLSGKPKWDVLLDIDELSKKDKIDWVFKGETGLYPNYERFLVFLSKGGKDADIVKEFNPSTKTFIEDGFEVPESKSNVYYFGKDSLLVATDFGPNTMTSSGYPRQVKLWKRGTPLKEADLVYEGDSTDMGTFPYVLKDQSVEHFFICQMLTFYTSNNFIIQNGKPVKLDLPDDCNIQGLLNNQLVVTLRSDWNINAKNFLQGSVISLNLTELLKGNKTIQLVYEPDENSSVIATSVTKNKLLLNILNNVNSELFICSFSKTWTKEKVETPAHGTISLDATDDQSDLYFLKFEDFLNPTTLYFSQGTKQLKALKTLPRFFDADNFKVEQYKVKSDDGTMIPYFVVCSKDIQLNGKNPTLLYAYGGFEIAELPVYLSLKGNAWLANGGVYVVANIRGGSEFGPKWHQAGLKEKRQNIYNDFAAVAKDLIARNITSSKNLGIMGGSNGGLLVGVAFTQHPELYNAVVCIVPLLDMKRYSKLLAGASWMAEYGDPDKPEEWEYIKKYSPYQNLKKNTIYPEVFFYTSTKDDRVHPGHARKMAAKMIDMGYKIYYYENTEGGHGGSATNAQKARKEALQYSYLLMKLKN